MILANMYRLLAAVHSHWYILSVVFSFRLFVSISLFLLANCVCVCVCVCPLLTASSIQTENNAFCVCAFIVHSRMKCERNPQLYSTINEAPLLSKGDCDESHFSPSPLLKRRTASKHIDISTLLSKNVYASMFNLINNLSHTHTGNSDWAVNRDDEYWKRRRKKMKKKNKNTEQNRRRSEWDPINFVVLLWFFFRKKMADNSRTRSPPSPHHCGGHCVVSPWPRPTVENVRTWFLVECVTCGEKQNREENSNTYTISEPNGR